MNKLITTAAALILGFGAAFAQLTASKAFVEAGPQRTP